MTIRYLWLLKSENHDQVFFERQHDIGFPSKHNQLNYRISPIFPALPEEFVDPNLKKKKFIGFYFCPSGFICLGWLLNKYQERFRSSILYSHGLASIIIFSDDLHTLLDIYQDKTFQYRGMEWWEIDNNIIIKSAIKLNEPVSYDADDYRIINYIDLSKDLRVILNELVHCKNIGVHRASMFMPELLPNFSLLVSVVNEIINELYFLEHPYTEPPKSLPQDIKEKITSNPIDLQRRIHQRTGFLIQINSNLSYVISQAFSGRPPILYNECPIRSYSLLGVGTSYQGIYCFTNFVEDIFSKYDVDNVVSDKYSIAAGIEIFPRIGQYNPEVWNSYSTKVDDCVSNIIRDDSVKKMVAFSGRQGFRETELAVTVPLQVLSAADTDRWSLMTLTHELIHGHVRGLLSAIFSCPELPQVNEHFYICYDYFTKICKGNSSREYKLKECLIFILFNYCRWKYSIKKKIKENSDIGRHPIEAFSFESLENIFIEEYREINEIMAHVLDYKYFYNCVDELYIPLLWSSWTPVPSVLEDIDSYLLRTIVTVATKETGNNTERFNYSLKIVKEILSELSDKYKESLLIKVAIRKINDSKIIKVIRKHFDPSLYLAEMTNIFLSSKHIHSELLNDKNRYLDGESFKYLIRDYDFLGTKIHSPIAFVSDRLYSSLNYETHKNPLEMRSCWLLYACSSVISEREDKKNDK